MDGMNGMNGINGGISSGLNGGVRKVNDEMNGGLDGGLNGIDGGISSGLQGGMPMGFGMSLAMKQDSMEGFASMTEAEKEKIILKARDAKSKKEMDRLVDSLAESDDEEVRRLRRESDR